VNPLRILLLAVGTAIMILLPLLLFSGCRVIILAR
jgi:hypothetical protein